LMNFSLFESMSPQEASEHLKGFLDTERAAIENMVFASGQAGVRMDFSVAYKSGDTILVLIR